MLMSAAFMFSALVQFALGLVVASLLGPAQFGIYALGIAAAVLGQTLAFEWLRLAIARYHDPREGEGLRRTLNRVMWILAIGSVLMSGLLYAIGGSSRIVLALLPLIAFAAGYAEYRSAFLRAQLDQRGFVLMTVARNLASIVLMPAAAIFLRTAEATLCAYAVALILGTVLSGLRSRPNAGDVSMAAGHRLRDLFAYSGPIIFTNLAYLGLFFIIRSYLALTNGVAEAGQFSLALEFGLKLVMTLGSAMDLYLFQLAVRESREGSGTDARLRDNAAMILALLAPLCIGIWLILPSIASLLIAPAFREAFSGYLAAILPGLFLFGVVQYVLHPFVQISGGTIRLVSAGLAAFVIAVLVLGIGSLLPGLSVAGISNRYGLVGLSIFAGMLAAATLLWIRIGVSARFGAMALLRLAIPCATMAVACLFIRSGTPGLMTLLSTAIAGALVYAGVSFAVNLAGLRTLWRATREG